MVTPETGDDLLQEFLADPANRTVGLATALARCARALGLPHAVAYLVDIQQRHLVPLTDVTSSLPVDGSLAGWAYRTQSLRVESSEAGTLTAWFPWWTGPSGSGCSRCTPPPSPRARSAAAGRWPPWWR